jgi:hypothetical protein
VSLTTAYFTVRGYDNVKLSLPDLHEAAVKMTLNESQLSVVGSQNIMFINSGNRPVAITRVDLKMDGPLTNDETQCPQNMLTFNYNLEPFVIKPGEIVVEKVKLSDKQQNSSISARDGVVSLHIDAATVSNKPAMFIFCLSINAETSDEVIDDIRVPLVRWNMLIPNQGSTGTFLFDSYKSPLIVPPPAAWRFDILTRADLLD